MAAPSDDVGELRAEVLALMREADAAGFSAAPPPAPASRDRSPASQHTSRTARGHARAGQPPPPPPGVGAHVETVEPSVPTRDGDAGDGGGEGDLLAGGGRASSLSDIIAGLAAGMGGGEGSGHVDRFTSWLSKRNDKLEAARRERAAAAEHDPECTFRPATSDSRRSYRGGVVAKPMLERMDEWERARQAKVAAAAAAAAAEALDGCTFQPNIATVPTAVPTATSPRQSQRRAASPRGAGVHDGAGVTTVLEGTPAPHVTQLPAVDAYISRMAAAREKAARVREAAETAGKRYTGHTTVPVAPRLATLARLGDPSAHAAASHGHGHASVNTGSSRVRTPPTSTSSTTSRHAVATSRHPVAPSRTVAPPEGPRSRTSHGSAPRSVSPRRFAQHPTGAASSSSPVATSQMRAGRAAPPDGSPRPAPAAVERELHSPPTHHHLPPDDGTKTVADPGAAAVDASVPNPAPVSVPPPPPGTVPVLLPNGMIAFLPTTPIVLPAGPGAFPLMAMSPPPATVQPSLAAMASPTQALGYAGHVAMEPSPVAAAAVARAAPPPPVITPSPPPPYSNVERVSAPAAPLPPPVQAPPPGARAATNPTPVGGGSPAATPPVSVTVRSRDAAVTFVSSPLRPPTSTSHTNGTTSATATATATQPPASMPPVVRAALHPTDQSALPPHSDISPPAGLDGSLFSAPPAPAPRLPAPTLGPAVSRYAPDLSRQLRADLSALLVNLQDEVNRATAPTVAGTTSGAAGSSADMLAATADALHDRLRSSGDTEAKVASLMTQMAALEKTLAAESAREAMLLHALAAGHMHSVGVAPATPPWSTGAPPALGGGGGGGGVPLTPWIAALFPHAAASPSTAASPSPPPVAGPAGMSAGYLSPVTKPSTAHAGVRQAPPPPRPAPAPVTGADGTQSTGMVVG